MQNEFLKVSLVRMQLYARICGFSRQYQVAFDAFVCNVNMVL